VKAADPHIRGLRPDDREVLGFARGVLQQMRRLVAIRARSCVSTGAMFAASHCSIGSD
jgi:hypothetical protein